MSDTSPAKCSYCNTITLDPCETSLLAQQCVYAHSDDSEYLPRRQNKHFAPHVATHDPVSKPNHYHRFKIEPIRFCMENELPFWAANVVKYVCRWDAKDGIQDLKKAKRYLEMRIKHLEGDPDWWK